MQKCIKIFKFLFRGNILAKGNQIQIKAFKENQLNLLSQFWSLGMKFPSTSQHICICESLFSLSEPLQHASCALFIMVRPGAIGGIGSRCCWNSPSGWERLQLSQALVFAPSTVRREESEGGERRKEQHMVVNNDHKVKGWLLYHIYSSL